MAICVCVEGQQSIFLFCAVRVCGLIVCVCVGAQAWENRLKAACVVFQEGSQWNVVHTRTVLTWESFSATHAASSLPLHIYIFCVCLPASVNDVTSPRSNYPLRNGCCRVRHNRRSDSVTKAADILAPGTNRRLNTRRPGEKQRCKQHTAGVQLLFYNLCSIKLHCLRPSRLRFNRLYTGRE